MGEVGNILVAFDYHSHILPDHSRLVRNIDERPIVPISLDGFPAVSQDRDGAGDFISFGYMTEVLNRHAADNLHLLLAVVRRYLPVLHFKGLYITNLNMNCLHLPERSLRLV